MDTLLANQTGSDQVIIITLVVTNVMTFLGLLVKTWYDIHRQIQDRLDRESAAKVAAMLGEARKNEILASTEAARKESKAALEVANGHNAKIAQIAAAQENPREVIVVNSQDKPVHVTKDLKVQL